MLTEKDKICYVDGLIAPDMVVNPDFLTFSIFEDFTRNREVVSDVKVWYKLSNEDMSMVKIRQGHSLNLNLSHHHLLCLMVVDAAVVDDLLEEDKLVR